MLFNSEMSLKAGNISSIAVTVLLILSG